MSGGKAYEVLWSKEVVSRPSLSGWLLYEKCWLTGKLFWSIVEEHSLDFSGPMEAGKFEGDLITLFQLLQSFSISLQFIFPNYQFTKFNENPTKILKTITMELKNESFVPLTNFKCIHAAKATPLELLCGKAASNRKRRTSQACCVVVRER